MGPSYHLLQDHCGHIDCGEPFTISIRTSGLLVRLRSCSDAQRALVELSALEETDMSHAATRGRHAVSIYYYGSAEGTTRVGPVEGICRPKGLCLPVEPLCRSGVGWIHKSVKAFCLGVESCRFPHPRAYIYIYMWRLFCVLQQDPMREFRGPLLVCMGLFAFQQFCGQVGGGYHSIVYHAIVTFH